mmetsp:Transcript_62768/g.72042  ORF Transcript_62768/g.72042 Transcript_62768/m.72042 type:complete len:151 (+) Transcript_62768:431-883(+)
MYHHWYHILTKTNQCGCPQILVVEEEFFNRVVMDTALKKLGVTADFAVDGYDALDQIEERVSAKKECCTFYRCIIMDYRMPQMTGVETTKRIIEKYGQGVYFPCCPTIAHSAYGEPEMSEFREAGAVGVLAKPLNFEHLSQLLKKHNVLM